MDKPRFSSSPGGTTRLGVKVLSVLTLFLMLAALIPAGAALATVSYATVTTHVAFSDDANQPSYWGADCYDAGNGGVGLPSYLLTQNYAEVIVKAGSGQYANTVFDNPTAGQTVWADTNGNNMFDPGGSDGDKEISHIIFCPAATLTLVKVVDNSADGTATTSDWTLSASGPTNISGTSGSPTVTGATVDPGTYTLSESTGPDNYAPSAWSCEGGSLDGSSLTLTAGESATCTITNTYIIPPSTYCIDISKVGGSQNALAGAVFTVEQNGTPVDVSGNPATTNSDGQAQVCGLLAGDYTVVETTPPAGYTGAAPQDVTLPGDTESGTVSLTFVDTLIQTGTGNLRVVKTLSGGPASYVGTYTVNVDCGDGVPGNETIHNTSTGYFEQDGLSLGTQCTVTEPSLPAAPSGWHYGTPVITGSPATITSAGSTVTVTVANSLIPDYTPPLYGYFQFSKALAGDLTGWTGGTFPFTVTCGGTNTSVNLTVGADGEAVTSSVFGPFNPGTKCSVAEGALPAAGTNASWVNSPSYSATSVTIPANGTATITVTNTRSYTPPTPTPTPTKSPSGGVAGATGTPSLPPTTEIPGQGGGPNGTILLLLGALGAASLALITTTLLRERLLERVDR